MPTEKRNDLAEVRDVLARRKRELIERYKAEGAAIGKAQPNDPTYVITIYLADRGSVPDGSPEVEGVPLKFVVTGKFEALE